MRPTVGDEFMAYLEALAGCFYPGLYAIVDEPVEELLGKPGLRAHLVLGHSPSMKPDDITAIAMVSQVPLASNSLPQEWKDILESSRRKSLRVDLFVNRRDAARVQKLVREVNARASVIALPDDLRKPVARWSIRGGGALVE